MVVPTTGWQYNATGSAISLVGSSFVANDIYEFSYTAKDPTVNGVGLAAIRDWNEFLRYETKDDAGTPNPMAPAGVPDITRIYTEISSQPGRTLNDFRYFGFNQAENGKQVLDGLMQWIAAGDGISLNYRWSQPGRTERNRQDHLFNEGRFPFANVMTTDPITGKTDSRYARCMATTPNTCPFAVEIFSGNEYWVKAASLMTTDPTGNRGSAGLAVHAHLLHVQHAARHRERDVEGKLPAVRESRWTHRRCSARCLRRSIYGSRKELNLRRASIRRLPVARWRRRCRKRAWAFPTFRA